MKCVLIVEDEHALLDVFASVVEELGHQVLTAHDGEEALALARAHEPDLIVTDHMMPRRTGLELLRAVRSDASLQHTPLVLVSAARPAGADEATLFLPKPIALESFEHAVETTLRGSGHREKGKPVAPSYKEGAVPGVRVEAFNWVAHEIKTPLSSAQMNVQLMLRHPSLDDEALRRRGESVLRQLHRMDSLVNSVLEAARLAEGRVSLQLEHVDLNQFLSGLIAYWRDLQPGYEFVVTLPAEPVEVRVDGEKVRQIVDNLISNAVKYGGASKRIEVRVEESPGRAVVHVTDHGVGISAHELPRIFERFHRAEGSAGQGHGLGLYIAGALAKLHRGTLHAHSEPGQGATFTLSLPRG